jgi:hypothetical protein
MIRDQRNIVFLYRTLENISVAWLEAPNQKSGIKCHRQADIQN